MTIKINGTNTAANPSITGSDTDTGIVYGSDQIDFSTAGSSKVTLSGANLGIGETSPLGNLHVKSADSGASVATYADELVVEGSVDSGMTILSGNNKDGSLAFGDDGNNVAGRVAYNHPSDSMQFFTGASERMRIDSSGNLLIGTTSTPDGSADGVLLAGGAGRAFSRGNTAMRYQLMFYNPNGMVGRIDTTGSSTNYLTSSDYRLKENATAIADGITRLKTLKPYRFNFKADATTILDGFFAHEVSTTVPEAISGTKDEVDSDNNPVYQAIDQSKLVPLLTAALQEAVAKIEVLETKVAALEAG